MRKSLRTKLIYILPVLVMLGLVFMSARKAEAGTGPSIEDEDITLYVGNTYQLTYDVGSNDSVAEEPDPDVDFWAWFEWYYGSNYVYFDSSDRDVLMVDDNGLITAMGKGTATVTLSTGSGSASVDVRVKNNGAYLSETEMTLYTGQTGSVKLSWSGKNIEGYSSKVYCRESGYVDYYYESYGVSVENRGGGYFDLVPHSKGHYYIYLILTLNGKTYSQKLEVDVVESGLVNTSMAVGLGCTVDIELTNATYVSARLLPRDWWSSNGGEVSIDANGRITGTSEGTARVEVTYRLAYGEMRTDTLTVYVTNPEYKAFTGPLKVGDYYELKYDGGSYYSRITIESSDTSVATTGTENWSADQVVPVGYGTCTLTITIDGKTFTDTITVIDPKLSFEYCLIKKGKTKTLKVTGVPEDTVITYKSSSKSIATVSSTGKIKGRKKGSCYITVNIGGTKLLCTVNVGTGTSTSAVLEGIKVLGAKYSQDRRMETGYYDCSSFAWRSYNAAGVKLCGVTYAPTAADLAKKLEAEGKAIYYGYTDPSNLKPGDLLFYTGYSNGRYKNIDHVAVYYGANYYLDGWSGEVENRGMIIHASSPGVNTRSYNGYRTGDIVMICRP